MVSVSNQFGRKVEGGILQNRARESNAVRRHLFGSRSGRPYEPEALADSFCRFLLTFRFALSVRLAPQAQSGCQKECHHSDIFRAQVTTANDQPT